MYYVEGEEEPETDPGKTQTPESQDEEDKPADSQNTKPDIPKNNSEDKDNANDQAESASSQIQLRSMQKRIGNHSSVVNLKGDGISDLIAYLAVGRKLLR